MNPIERVHFSTKNPPDTIILVANINALASSSTTSDRLLNHHDRQTAIALLIISQYILVICSTASPVNERTSLHSNSELGLSNGQIQHSISNEPDNYQQPSTFRIQSPQMNQNGWLPSSRQYENMNQPDLTRPKSNASPPQSVSSATGHNKPESDLLSEGSGDGPIQTSRNHHSAKLDDTEDGDDDEEDYDYKDTLDIGSGNGNQTPETKKTEQPVLEANNQLKRPNINETELYLPFRPPNYPQSIAPTVARNNSRQSTISQTTAMPASYSSTIHQELLDRELGRVKQSSSQTDTRPTLGNEISSQTPGSQNSFPSNSPTIAPKAIETSSHFTPTATTPTLSNRPTDKPEKNHPSSSTLNISPAKINNQNSSSISRPHVPTHGDVDYEYEDESDDDDSEDASNFEDNESSDANMPVSKPTVGHTFTTNDTQKKTTSPQPMQPLPTTSNPRAVTSSINRMTLSSFLHPNNAQSTSHGLPETLVPTVKPNLSIPTTKNPMVYTVSTEEVVTGDDDINEEENDDEEEDENDDEDLDDEVEDDIEADDEDQGLGDRPTSNIVNQSDNQMINSTVKPQHYPKLPPVSTSLDNTNGQHTPQRGSHTNQFPSPTPKPHYPQVEDQPIVTIASVKTQYRAPTTPVSPLPADIIPKVAVSTSTTIAPQPPTAPHVSISTTTRTTSPKLIHSTTPRPMVPPSITRTSTIQTYSNLPNDDDDLTRQIYDKAVEVYQFANKAFNSALEVVMSPKLELNSSTFEPLLASSLIFMLTLGAAVIGLVLTMMLVVYIINNQMLPKDDVSIY